MSIHVDELHRTAKLFVEEGRVETFDAAVALLETYVLQVDVGTGIASSPTRQAMLLTIVNTGRRAFLGGVQVRIADDPVLTVGWAEGLRLSAAIAAWGGKVVTEIDEEHPSIGIGPVAATSGLTLWPTWNGWSGGVVVTPDRRLAEEREFEPAGAMAGAMAVSECFQFLNGSQRAARRDFGLGLWRPELDWRDREALGPRCANLPVACWLLGLGHLGQAFAWLLGLLPYGDRREVSVVLQDYDFVTRANESTSLFAAPGNIDSRKTRLVSEHLEGLGFRTTIVERAFDEKTRRTGEEPLLALSGFDKPEPRRLLGAAGFDRVVDAGLGAGKDHYLDLLIQSFPRDTGTTDKFPSIPAERSIEELLAIPAYGGMVETLVAEGKERGEVECGIVELAGATVGASFVGAVAAAISLSEPLRLLHGGSSCEAISFSLRSPERVDVAVSAHSSAPGFGHAAARGGD